MTTTIEELETMDRLWQLDDNIQLVTELAAILLGQAPTTLKAWRTRGIGPSYKLGRPVTYSIRDLKIYLERQRVDFG